MMEFKEVKMEQVLRAKNSEAKNLAKIALLGTGQLP